MRIAIASDHGGFNLKEIIKKALTDWGYEYTDFGCHSTESVDYPQVARGALEGILKGEFDRGILVCGTGIGMSIVANKFTGIRAALCHDTFSAKATREHNDTNVIALGERVIGSGLALDIVKIWLETKFEGGRHTKRVDQIKEIETCFLKNNV